MRRGRCKNASSGKGVTITVATLGARSAGRAEVLRGKAKLVGPDGEIKLLPDSLYLFLVDLIGFLSAGQCVYIVRNQAKLTTVEAATMLGVSRQFLVNLLEKG